MKSFFFSFLLLGLTVQVFSQDKDTTINSKAEVANGPQISWENPSHNFGDIIQGDKVEHVFKFTNTGNEPLIITDVQVTCGCTTPKGWLRDPIMPGQSGEIVIAFNSTGKMGAQTKISTVISNAVNPDGAKIKFEANVINKKSDN